MILKRDGNKEYIFLTSICNWWGGSFATVVLLAFISLLFQGKKNINQIAAITNHSSALVRLPFSKILQSRQTCAVNGGHLLLPPLAVPQTRPFPRSSHPTRGQGSAHRARVLSVAPQQMQTVRPEPQRSAAFQLLLLTLLALFAVGVSFADVS